MAPGIRTTHHLGAAVRRAAASSSSQPAFARGYAAMKRKAILSERGAAPAASPPTTASPKEKAKAKASGKAPAPAETPDKPKALSAEEQNLQSLAEIDRIMAFQHLMPTVDPWGQPIVDTLDVAVPRPLTLALLRAPRALFEHLKTEAINAMKNWASLNLLAGNNAIPGAHLKALPWHQQAALVFRTGGTRSTRPGSLLAPLRALAADAYAELNTALAQRNPKDLARLTTSSYRTHTLALVKAAKARNPQAVHMRWTLHRHVSPVQVVSLRATQGYMAPAEPRGGHRLLVHALVKFDTEQSLEMYTARGVPLHTPAEPSPSDAPSSTTTTPSAPSPSADARQLQDGKPQSKEAHEPWRVPAQRRRVTEYIVLEKKGWAATPWQFREQMW
ncbi:hypothetical protein HYPSUDRAFT_201689 [Hypholoma sublateritium FD-334 SS-4]|uniref:Uncharacterized protein n=1 Tax=Hypholoma sublateritium (strain FD-334 SS-4) TaxID=945553 RepID=A0A0D2NWJ7_HYPSF|nr:hypothetical protein HYPSUDRAFT_201689 [Hypholoma sublateritium FD-334 SS-4]